MISAEHAAPHAFLALGFGHATRAAMEQEIAAEARAYFERQFGDLQLDLSRREKRISRMHALYRRRRR